MRNRARYGAALLVLVALGTGVPAAHQAAATETKSRPAISAERLMATVRTLASKEFAGRGAGTEGGAQARSLIRGQFGTLKLATVGESFEHPFTFTPKSGDPGVRSEVRGVNVIGRCRGTAALPSSIVVSAHYDHLGIRNGALYPGADDNASGTAVLLELAASCMAAPFRHDVVFAAFDAEEGGLQGARAFVAQPTIPQKQIAVNVNLDMVARGDKGELYIAGTHHTPRLRPLLEPVASRAPIRVLFGHDLPGSGEDDWTLQSDHGPFHQAGLPFVYFGVEDHPDYHQPGDTADKINPDFFARSAAVILDALVALDAGLH